jgi:AraC-like DNA-binding protein
MTSPAPARIADLAFDVDVFFHGQVCGRFGLDTSADGRLGFHIVISGTCWAHAAALPAPRRLQPGDALLFGRAVPHVISDAREHRDRRDPEAVVALGTRAGLPATGLLCGYFEARNAVAGEWLRSFPDCCVVEGGRTTTRWPLELARLMAGEAAAGRDSATCLASRMAELFLAMSLREHCERGAGASRLVRARRDPQLRAVLDAIDADLARKWTVAELAALSGVCRAKFAAWFARELGCPPIAYLRSRRMRAAERLARSGDLGDAQLAEEVGYRSVSAFRRHFREHRRHAPAAANQA